MKLKSITSHPLIIPAAIIIALLLVIAIPLAMIGVSDSTTTSKNRVVWEKISVDFLNTSYRTEVPGGWLVRSSGGKALVFLSDPEHKWLRTSR